MASKTWTATDVVLGKLTIWPATGGKIKVSRRYQFLDAAGQVLEGLAGGRVLEDASIVDLPADIRSALQKIDDWTKRKALEAEGMD